MGWPAPPTARGDTPTQASCSMSSPRRKRWARTPMVARPLPGYSENGVTFQTLIVNDQLSKCLLQSINAFPTTIFVDREGNLVGAEQIGVPAGDSAAEAYLALINERLALLK